MIIPVDIWGHHVEASICFLPLTYSDWSVPPKRARPIETFCWRGLRISISWRKQRVCLHSSEDSAWYFFSSSILLSLSYSLKLFCLPELSARRRLGQSFLRTSNIKNIHGGWVNCTCWFIEGKSNYCLLNIPDIEETHY